MTGRAGRAGRPRQGGGPAGVRGARATRPTPTPTRSRSGSPATRTTPVTWCRRPTCGPTGASKRFRGDAQFTTWLYRITANCAATQLGRAPRHRHEELDDDTGRSSTTARPRSRGPGRRGRPARPRRGGARRAAAPAAGGRRAARRLRPAPRGDRRRAGHLRVGGQGAAPPGPAQAARAGVPRPRRTSEDEEQAHAV